MLASTYTQKLRSAGPKAVIAPCRKTDEDSAPPVYAPEPVTSGRPARKPRFTLLATASSRTGSDFEVDVYRPRDEGFVRALTVRGNAISVDEYDILSTERESKAFVYLGTSDRCVAFRTYTDFMSFVKLQASMVGGYSQWDGEEMRAKFRAAQELFAELPEEAQQCREVAEYVME